MSQPSLTPIRRLLLRQSTAIFGSSLLVLLLSCMLTMGMQFVLEQERAALTADFTTTIAYVREQEQFLRQLQDENTRVQSLLDPQPTLRRPATPSRKEHLPETGPAFSLLTRNTAEPMSAEQKRAFQALALHLTSIYNTFWAFSYYPSANLLMLNEDGQTIITVPAIDAANTPEPLTPEVLQQISQVAQQHATTLRADVQRMAPETSAIVHWYPMPGMPHEMLAFIPSGVPPSAWPAGSPAPDEHYLVSLMNRQRLLTASGAHEASSHLFWLSNARQGILLGGENAPVMRPDGFRLSAEGLELCLRSQPGDWVGCYRISYGSFVAHNIWIPVTGGLLLLLCLLWGIGYLRWYQRSIIDPAQQAQDALQESEMFNRALVDTAPVALCLLSCPDGHIIFASPLARRWLSLVPDATANGSALQRLALEALEPGEIEQVDLPGGLSLHVSYSPMRYRKQDVVLCAFTDITTRAEEQRALERAKQAADEANAAKSMFLSTMSHEIRTPLYGVLGTLELLALTKLDTVQQQHVARIQSASQLLMQQISDILDIGKIEANQLQLEPDPFSPRRMMQECVGSYAGMAQQKQLLLFCLTDPQVPDMLEGDAVRIRQVLSNLVSNAIKFTEAGQIVVRLSLVRQEDDHSILKFQVADTGIGISQEAQRELFSPFFMVEASRHTIRGTGLGLSICERLVHLMGGTIQVTSEPGLGSQFSVELPLQHTDAEVPAAPVLDGLTVLLRTANPELTRNLECWLIRWGAQAGAAPAVLPMPDKDTWLVDVQMPAPDCPPNWAARYMSLAPREGTGTHPGIDACSVDEIAAGLARLGQPPEAVHVAPTRRLALKALIAEDNPINQATLTHQLEQLGCQVSVASDGEQALELWQQGTHDFVLTDINMPRMNGYELSRALRDLGVRAPIVGITANATRNEGRHCMESGMNTWLVKPINLNSLYQQLARLFPAAVRPATPAPATSPAPVPAAPEPAPETSAAPTPPAAATDFSHTPIHPVPEAYRTLFLDTMQADLDKLEQGRQAEDVERILHTLHRVAGGLASINNQPLASAIVLLHEQLRTDGLTPSTRKALQSLADRLGEMLANT